MLQERGKSKDSRASPGLPERDPLLDLYITSLGLAQAVKGMTCAG